MRDLGKEMDRVQLDVMVLASVLEALLGECQEDQRKDLIRKIQVAVSHAAGDLRRRPDPPHSYLEGFPFLGEIFRQPR